MFFLHPKKKDLVKLIINMEDGYEKCNQEISELKTINSELLKILQDVKSNYEILDIVIQNTIDNEKGKETNFTKFDSLFDFAKYLEQVNASNISIINKKLEKIKNLID